MYSICKKTYDDGSDGSHLCTEHTDLLADKYYTSYLFLSSICSHFSLHFLLNISAAKLLPGFIIPVKQVLNNLLLERGIPSVKESHYCHGLASA